MMGFDAIDRQYQRPEVKLECVRCGSTVGVELEESRRMDVDEKQPYCRPCATEHHAYWDEMWAEYYAGRL